MNADLFFLLALQQTCKGLKVTLHYPPCGAVWCLFTLASPTQATSPPGGLGAKGRPVELSVSWCGCFRSKQPLLLAAAAVDLVNSLCSDW